MLFNSFEYALFLPLVWVLFWLPIGRNRALWQNLVLLIASYIFYCAWDWRFAFLIALTSLSSYGTGILIEKKRKKLWLILNAALNLGILAFFKYAGFFVESFEALMGLFGVTLSHSTLKIILPVGISFYTFQAIGYTIDVWRGKVKASRDVLKFCAFVSFFPQLVAGPIERASRLLPQFDKTRTFDYKNAVNGICLIIWGVFLKLVIADRLAVFVDAAWKALDGISGASALLAVIFFAFQLYTDFYSYSEIARGSAKLFGMELMVNFRRPYLSLTFKEFWKRWHISLSSWFGDYVYIPLGGNRKGTARRILNVFIVFLLSGLWHGASWTFVVWGFLCALFMLVLDPLLSRTASLKPLNRLVVFAFWAVSLILFRAPDFSSAVSMAGSLGFGNWGAVTSYGMGIPELVTAIALLVLLVIQEIVWEKRGEPIRERFLNSSSIVRVLCAIAAIIVIIILGRYGLGNDSQFIYFQF
jgi:D-alanyl-lipoteichoic acid acyltransferase DltB (MBOAT superfamily)